MKIRTISYSADYTNVKQAGRAKGERNDCSVVAVSIICQVPYEVAHEELARLGRKSGRGAYWMDIHRAIANLGKTMRRLEPRDMIALYPGVHKNLQHVTTHHPRRFPMAWDKSKRYLIHVNGHCLAVAGGEVHDWSINRSLRVNSIYEVHQ